MARLPASTKTAFGVGGEALGVGYVPDVNGLAGQDAGCVEKVLVHRYAALVGHVRFGGHALTSRELEVLLTLHEELTTDEIGSRLFISLLTPAR
jgi:hypothetical protein